MGMDTVKVAAKAPVICPICGKSFKDNRGLGGHKSGVHGAYRGNRGAIEKGFMELHQEDTRQFEELAKRLGASIAEGFKYLCQELNKQGKGSVCTARFEQHNHTHAASKCSLEKS
jgi:hypothetical protein